jgi:hypothetical protein
VFSITFENYNNKTKNGTTTFRDRSSKNIETFKESLANLSWSTIEESIDPAYAYTTFLATYTSIYNKCFPKKTSKKIIKCISLGFLKDL